MATSDTKMTTDMELAEEIEQWGLSAFDDSPQKARAAAETQIIAALRRGPGRVVYQCPRCATSMEVDPTAKPSERPPSGEMLVIAAMDAVGEWKTISKIAEPNFENAMAELARVLELAAPQKETK